MTRSRGQLIGFGLTRSFKTLSSFREQKAQSKVPIAGWSRLSELVTDGSNLFSEAGHKRFCSQHSGLLARWWRQERIKHHDQFSYVESIAAFVLIKGDLDSLSPRCVRRFCRYSSQFAPCFIWFSPRACSVIS